MKLLSPDLLSVEPKQAEICLGSELPSLAIVGLFVLTCRAKSRGVIGVNVSPFLSKDCR